jgi:hypothetical protein
MPKLFISTDKNVKTDQNKKLDHTIPPPPAPNPCMWETDGIMDAAPIHPSARSIAHPHCMPAAKQSRGLYSHESSLNKLLFEASFLSGCQRFFKFWSDVL